MMPLTYPSDPIDYFVERRRNARLILPTSEEQQATFLAEIEAYRDELQSLSGYDLNLRVCEELANERRAQEKRERASFPFWCRLASWSLDDAVALTFAKDPDLVDWSAKYAGEMVALAAPPAGAYARLRRQVMAAKNPAHRSSRA